ncbi:hypothetical protein Hanom_Chr07g00633051 [Helianthus anomalus]
MSPFYNGVRDRIYLHIESILLVGTYLVFLASERRLSSGFCVVTAAISEF